MIKLIYTFVDYYGKCYLIHKFLSIHPDALDLAIVISKHSTPHMNLHAIKKE